jgi:2-polyprenyl-3-methyl-5-hydroxy-6-metoxy-1,4-benzoquinol methylase
MTEGNREFYAKLYSRLRERNLYPRNLVRKEFELAARRIAPGDRVLDVGCGFANFHRIVPQSDYVGLDPNFATDNAAEGALNQTLEEHLIEHRGIYDVVCAFQVIEHVASPSKFFADMVQAVRPGGAVIVGVPHVPSAHTRIPNFLLNAPPHHLTWWTAKALSAVAERQMTTVESIEHVPWGECDSLIYWMERCSPIRCRDLHYRDAWR